MTAADAIAKVRALLALANSANEHEAANAAAAANAIMARYRLDAAMLAEAEQAADVAAEVEPEPFRANHDAAAEREHDRMPTWYWALAWGVATANRCKPRSDGARVYFLGRPSDANAARYQLDAIANDVDRLAAAYVGRHPSHRRRALGKAFRLGATRTIADRLRTVADETAAAMRRELAGDQRALVRLDGAIARQAADAEALGAWCEDHGFTYSRPRRAVVSSREGYLAGKAAGEGVRLAGGAASLGTGPRALGKGRGAS